MSRSHKNRKEESKEEKPQPNTFIPPEIVTEKPKANNYRTVGTVRLSKSGNAISIKLIAESRFLHVSRRDIELILMDINHATVANVREYDKVQPSGETNNGES
jgi:hypothetical protein